MALYEWERIYNGSDFGRPRAGGGVLRPGRERGGWELFETLGCTCG